MIHLQVIHDLFCQDESNRWPEHHTQLQILKLQPLSGESRIVGFRSSFYETVLWWWDMPSQYSTLSTIHDQPAHVIRDKLLPDSQYADCRETAEVDRVLGLNSMVGPMGYWQHWCSAPLASGRFRSADHATDNKTRTHSRLISNHRVRSVANDLHVILEHPAWLEQTHISHS